MGIYRKNFDKSKERWRDEICIIMPDNLLGYSVTGVYVIYLGDHFYIGKSKDIMRRASLHVSNFQALTRKNDKKYGKRYKISKFLLDNPNLYIFYLQVLVKCKDDELDYVEQFFLNEYRDDKKCLNTQHNSHA